MDSHRIKITIDVFDETNQLASVRSTLLASDLVAEIRREFDLDPGNYALHIKGHDETLPLDKSLTDLGVSEGDALVFGRRRFRRVPGGTKPITQADTAYLQEEQTGHIFEIQYTPAVIARPYANNAASAESLAVPLGEEFAEFRSVSRNRHAQIIEQNGRYFIESLKENNLAGVNDVNVEVGERRKLNPGDRIRIGKILLTFYLSKASPEP